MFRLEPYSPVKLEQMIGQSIDIFHKNPEHQRRLLSDPRNLPHNATIRVGPETVDLMVTAILDHSGRYLGPMLTWEIVTEKHEAKAREDELQANTAAVNQVLLGLGRARGAEEPLTTALDIVRNAFDFAYASYWRVDPASQTLSFVVDSGTVDDSFRQANRTARFREGEGLNGRAWRTRDLYAAPDLAELTDCSRAPLARRLGITSAVAIPVQIGAEVVGTLDFMSTKAIPLGEGRKEALRSIARLISSALERADQRARMEESRKDLELKVSKLMRVAEVAAGGDLTVSVEVLGDDDMGRLGVALSEMIRDLKGVLGQVIESANQFAEASQVIAESATYLSESSQNQAATVEEMLASVSQLNRSIQEINW
ncbi:MAG: GAF domain-containing protein [Isosphaeraceae bacterium]